LIVLMCGWLANGIALAAELRDVRIERLAGEDRISLTVTEQVPLAVFVLGAPDRVVADFEHLSMGPDVALADLTGRWVRAVRHGMHAGDKLRLVFDLSGSANVDLSYDQRASGGVFVLRLFSSESAVEPPRPQQEVTDPDTIHEDARAEAEAAAEALVRSRIGAPGTIGAPPDGFKRPASSPLEDEGWRTLPLPPSMQEEGTPVLEPERPLH
jgi:hypothetical protein